MILNSRNLFKEFGTSALLNQTYSPIQHTPFLFQHLSNVAQLTLASFSPNLVSKQLEPNRPEIIALRILDFLSSKKDFIRRKAHNFRNEEYYGKLYPILTQQIQNGQTLSFSGLCISVNIPNPQLTGHSPYPHIGLYLACENIHKIAVGVKSIYKPGATFFLGFESNLYQKLYLLSSEIVRYSYDTAQNMNNMAYGLISTQDYEKNPVVIKDVHEMVLSSFGSIKKFEEEVERIQDHVAVLHEWVSWYRKTIPDTFFPSNEAKELFIKDMSRWRAAVNELKYTGGEFDKGFVGFYPDIIPFTSSGRRINMLALQMIPRNDPLPHQRIMTYLPSSNRWLLQAYESIVQDSTIFLPSYVKEYNYPFFYEATSL